MDLGTLIETHGYWVLALGCLLEGETVLVLAGFAAHRGYLALPWVIGIAAAAGFAGDQFFFWLGRRHGARVMARWPSVERRADQVHRLIERHHEWLIIGVRFAYGLRIAGPILIGTSPIAAARFALFNAIGALAWATLIGGLGWLFGTAVERLLGEVHRVEVWLFAALAAVGIGLALVHACRRR
ncbi:MAG: DedA family protein [Burkholderiaceae bacterium]